MTFTARPIAPFKIDILEGSDPSSFTAGAQIPCTGTPSNTNATVSSGQITLPAGSHWRLEYSPAFLSTDTTNGYVKYQISFYSVTESNNIGQVMYASSDGSNYDPNRAGRCVASALILNSQITGSYTVEVKLLSELNMTGASSFPSYDNTVGKSTFRIMELPA